MLRPHPRRRRRPTTIADAAPALVPGGQVGRLTRWIALAVIFFLADAVQLLLLLPDRTGELFAWAIDPQVTRSCSAPRTSPAPTSSSASDGRTAGIASPPASPPSSSSCGARRARPHCTSTASSMTGSRSPPGRGSTRSRPSGCRCSISPAAARVRVPFADTPLPVRTRIVLGGVGGAIVVAALLAFALPQITIDVWPWTLTPLTARIVATVMALFGSLWVSVALHGGRTAARIPLEAHGLGLVFLLIAAGRGSRRPRLDQPAGRDPGRRRRSDGARRRGHPGPGAALRGSGPGGPRVVAAAAASRDSIPCSGPPSPNSPASSSPRPATRSCRI